MEFNATLIVSAISFIVFIFVMNTILYNPILKVIQEREDFIDANLGESTSLADKAKAILLDKESKLKDAHKLAKQSIALGIDSSKKDASNTLNSAISSSKDKVDQEKNRLSNEEGDAKYKLTQNVAELAKSITEKLLGQQVQDFEFNQEVVDEALNNV